MAYTTIVAGTTATAAWANANVRDQVVSPFTDAAARTSAISSPVNGMLSVLTTTDRVDVYNGASWSALVAPSNGSLTSWTPVVVQGATPTLTNTASTYIRTGRWIQGMFNLAITSAGTASNLVTVSLPVTAVGTGVNWYLGRGALTDTSATSTSLCDLVLNSTTTMKFQREGGTVPTYLGLSAPFTAAFASGDFVMGQFQYEAAADA